MVSFLAIAISEVGLDTPDHHLDSEYYPHLHRLALAYPGTSVVGSWLDVAAGIRSCGNGWSDYRNAEQA
jgi:hypothetical protein